MYQPKIADEHIRALYQWAKRLDIPMTRLINALLAHALVRLEQGVENVHESAALSKQAPAENCRCTQEGHRPELA
jgi:hypothetical protein